MVAQLSGATTTGADMPEPLLIRSPEANSNISAGETMSTSSSSATSTSLSSQPFPTGNASESKKHTHFDPTPDIDWFLATDTFSLVFHTTGDLPHVERTFSMQSISKLGSSCGIGMTISTLIMHLLPLLLCW
jgi:hypothetical protein